MISVYLILVVIITSAGWFPTDLIQVAKAAGNDGITSKDYSSQLPTYRISTVTHAPWVIKKDGGRFEGFIVDLLDEIAKLSAFNYVLKTSTDNTYGMIHHMTGEWRGIIGDVISGEADLGVADLAITEERSKVVSFSSPFTRTGAQILLKKPTSHRIPLLTLLYPFSVGVWVLFIVAIVVVGGLFYVIDRFSPYGWRNVTESSDLRHGRMCFSPANSYLFAISTFLWQGYHEAPKCVSGRVLACFWWSFVITMLFSYSSNLTALFITASSVGLHEPVLPFKTFSEMAQQSDVVYGGWFGLILNPNDQLQRTMDRFMGSRYTHYQDLNEAVARIRKSEGRFAAIVEGKDAEYVVRRNCDLILLREKLFDLQYGIACRPGHEGERLCANISAAVMSLYEDGTIHSLQQNWWETDRTCPETAEDDYVSGTNRAFVPFRALTVSDVSFGFLLLLIGIIISLVTLVVEIIYDRRKRINKDSHNNVEIIPKEAPAVAAPVKVINMIEPASNKIENEDYPPIDET